MTPHISEFENADPNGFNNKEQCELAWLEFSIAHPTEFSCAVALFEHFVENGILKCKKCGRSDSFRLLDERTAVCEACNTNCWFTAKTWFDRVKKLRPYLGAIWLMERGLIVTSTFLHKSAECAQSTASVLLNKLRSVLENNMNADCVQIPSIQFLLAFTKRTRETQPRMHPQSEETGMDKPIYSNFSTEPTPSFNPKTEQASNSDQQSKCNSSEYATSSSSETEAEQNSLVVEIFRFLSNKPMTMEAICAALKTSVDVITPSLVGLELTGQIVLLPGNKYVLATNQSGSAKFELSSDVSVSNDELIREIISKLNKVHNGVGRKYFQKYLAAIWCHFDRERWKIGALLKACSKAENMSGSELLRYVSDKVLRVMPLPA